MTQNDCFGYVNLGVAFVKVILWLSTFLTDNRRNTTASCYINLFQADVPFLYLMKTSEYLWFSCIIREYRNGTSAWNRLTGYSK